MLSAAIDVADTLLFCATAPIYLAQLESIVIAIAQLPSQSPTHVVKDVLQPLPEDRDRPSLM